MWSADLYQKAIKFAGEAHTSQKIPGSALPYVVHLSNVAMEVMRVLPNTSSEISSDFAVICALLHDILEDTEVTFQEIEKAFGNRIAQIVQSLTKRSDLPKSEAMKDSLERILLQPKEAAMVKLADRITNLQAPPDHWDIDKRKKYVEEAKLILEELGFVNQELAERLSKKIEEYQTYLA